MNPILFCSCLSSSGQIADSIAPSGWNVFIESPPVEDSAPQNVLKYLARYMSGGPISDRRLISHDRGVVKFWARSKQKPAVGQKPQQVIEKLPAVEFTRRWALHILPKNFIKSRNYGGFANTKCADYLELCRQLLDIEPSGQPDLEQADNQQATEPEPDQPLELDCRLPGCPQCGNPMAPKRITTRPGWSIVMNSIHRPPWYRRQWDETTFPIQGRLQILSVLSTGIGPLRCCRQTAPKGPGNRYDQTPSSRRPLQEKAGTDLRDLIFSCSRNSSRDSIRIHGEREDGSAQRTIYPSQK